MQRPARVLVVDDSPATRLGLHVMLSSDHCVDVVGEADTALSALEQTVTAHPDVILLTPHLLGNRLAQTIDRLRDRHPEVKLIFLMDRTQDEPGSQLPIGADGYISIHSSKTELVEAVLSVFGGRAVIGADCAGAFLRQYEASERELVRLKFGLSAQEVELLRELASGATNEQIASRLYLSEVTVMRKTQHIVDKLGVANKIQAVAEVIRNGII